MVRTLALASALALLGSSASAGVVMEWTDLGPGDAAPVLSKAYGTEDRVRIETAGALVIFRGDKKVAWLVDLEDKSYVEVTEAGLPGMAEARKEMEAEMAAMSPEERAMFDAMMKQQMGAMFQKPEPPKPMTWAANGSSDTVAGRTCQGYDGTRAGKLEETICATDWSTFGLAASDFEGFRRMAEFMSTMAGPMAGQAPRGVVDPGMPGVPLRSVTKSPQGDHRHELTKLEKAGVDAALFELPPGLKAETLEDAPAPPRGGRRR